MLRWARSLALPFTLGLLATVVRGVNPGVDHGPCSVGTSCTESTVGPRRGSRISERRDEGNEPDRLSRAHFTLQNDARTASFALVHTLTLSIEAPRVAPRSDSILTVCR